ncbi:hypothetical protein LCGC14_0328210 [marine sediment metagenome]|uniref:Toprim domain-containing protein n=1 Tax=marine sediment metagenome TaxID=412755 RepID=A0A0F9TZY9_9ZZZZ
MAGSQQDQSKALTVGRIYFQSHLSHDTASAYVSKRRLSSSDIRKFEIGYAPDQWRGLVDHYSSHRIRLAAVDAGLLTTPEHSNRLLDFFRNRLIFPIRDHHGDLVGYGGRTLSDDPKTPKYINTPETELFNKSELLYGLHQNKAAIQSSGDAIVVEGYMDVVALSRHGCQLAVAPMGTALTHQQISLLIDQGIKSIWICLDGDAAGQKAAERSIAVIMDSYDPRVCIRLMSLPEGHDPDTFMEAFGLEAFNKLKGEAKDLPSFIDDICQNGRPCLSLEDKASYMLRLKPYLESSCGILKDTLLHRASKVSGLTISDIQESFGFHQDEAVVSNWSPMITHAARAIVHSDNGKDIARTVSDFQLTGPGFDELEALCDEVISDQKPSGLLAQYARAHGKQSELEDRLISSELLPFLRSSSIDQALEKVQNAPYDHQARVDIKKALGIG